MRTIELKCRCGAEIKLTESEDKSQYFLENQISLWRKMHKGCLVSKVVDFPNPINPPGPEAKPYQVVPCYAGDGTNNGVPSHDF